MKGYRNAEIPGSPLVPEIDHGHDSHIGTYNGLRTISQRVNTAVRSLARDFLIAIRGPRR